MIRFLAVSLTLLSFAGNWRVCAEEFENVSGSWRYTSFVIDAKTIDRSDWSEGKHTSAPPPAVTARAWATGILKVTETMDDNGHSKIKGELQIERHGVKGVLIPLKISGRRQVVHGETSFLLNGENPVPNTGGSLKFKYTIVGYPSASYSTKGGPAGGNEKTLISGSIRADEVDPYAPPGTVGYFILERVKNN